MFKAIQALNALSSVSPFTDSVSSDSSRASPEMPDFNPLISRPEELIISDLQSDIILFSNAISAVETADDETLERWAEETRDFATRLEALGKDEFSESTREAAFWLQGAACVSCPQGLPTLFKSVRQRLEQIIKVLENSKPSQEEHFSF